METPSFFERQSVKKWSWRLLIGSLTVLFCIDVFVLDRYSKFSKHGGIQSIDGSVFFYVGIAFFGALFLGLVAKILHKLLSAEETYYTNDY
jgi:hypothetical protein